MSWKATIGRWKYRWPIIKRLIRRPLFSMIQEGNYLTFCMYLEHGVKPGGMNLHWYRDSNV